LPSVDELTITICIVIRPRGFSRNSDDAMNNPDNVYKPEQDKIDTRNNEFNALWLYTIFSVPILIALSFWATGYLFLRR
jgi:hypothetical protein